MKEAIFFKTNICAADGRVLETRRVWIRGGETWNGQEPPVLETDKPLPDGAAYATGCHMLVCNYTEFAHGEFADCIDGDCGYPQFA